MTQEAYLAAIGTYSTADTEGLHTIEVDAATGAMRLLDSAVAGPDPTFVAPHQSEKILYAAIREEGEGIIKSFKIDRDSGDLDAIDSAQSGALGPCYCSVDSTGRFLFVAHYTGGAISVLPIDESGNIESPTTIIEHHGSSVNQERQRSPHPHSIVPGPDNQFVYVPDLGTDQITIYEFNSKEGTLSLHAETDVQPGAGPRHLAFSPDGEQVYLINELDSTIITFDRKSDGELIEQSVIMTLPDGFDGENKTAEVTVHPSGRFIFGSNRGHDSIATFTVTDDGLSLVDHTPTGGEWPRHFAITPDGQFLLVENRDSDEITAFRINKRNGALSPVDEQLSVSQPVCLQWLFQ